MPTENDIFGGMGGGKGGMGMGGGMPPPGGAPEIGDSELDDMFGEGEDMGGDQQTKLTDSLISAGFSPSPDQVSQIMEILQGGGMAPEGLEPTESGMESMPPAM